MKCQHCKSERLADVKGKCSGNCLVQFAGFDTEGIIPDDLGIGGGDYLRFTVCLNCGYMQGDYPISLSYLEKDLSDQDTIDFYNDHFVEGEDIKDLGFRYLDPIIQEAKDLHPKLGKFVDDFFNSALLPNISSRGTKRYKFPSAKKFAQMFKDNNSSLE